MTSQNSPPPAQITTDLHTTRYIHSQTLVYEGNTKFNVLNVHGPVHRRNILIYIQQDATLHSLFYLERALHVSGDTITHHQERKQLYLQHPVFVTPL